MSSEFHLSLSPQTLSNYANHLFDTSVDPAFAAWTWKQ